MDNEQLEIMSDKDLDYAQEGYRFNPVENKVIEDWAEIVGNSYYVIGFDSMLGDPILVDTSKPELPVYQMMSEEWEKVYPIAKSFNEFISNLKKLDEMINVKKAPRETVREFAVSLDEAIHSAGFYEAICFDIIDPDGLLYDEY